MGSLTLLKGNLFASSHEVIGHGTNCRGGFGSGVAGQIAKRFPEVKRAYLRKHQTEGWSPGEIQIVKTDGWQHVANLATQDRYGSTGGPYVIYDAVRQAIASLLTVCETRQWGVALPKIGCGLAGGDWTKVQKIIEEELEGRDVEVDVYYL